MEGRPIIRTEGLTKRYGGYEAVRSLSLEVREGEIFGFLGPNGAGKTTTLLMLLGLTVPTAGTVEVCGLDPVRRARAVKQLVGYLPENVGFYGDLDAVESLAYIAALNGRSPADSARLVPGLLEQVGLADAARKKVGFFSRGMRQRLGIAEVLLKEPKVLLLDEPTLGLDPDGAARLIGLIEALNRERNMTVLLSSHNLHQVQRISHRVGIMIEGGMVASGPIDALAEQTFGLGGSRYSLEEIYLKYFQEG
ncbi:Bacitracin transport ATP-binding protein BcrA (fragment) [uncultured Desulfatiglans sp.]|uniref:Bacitracin transport ATP-binding protein BcrA n=1 Tax=Uncultured Desulfatiglans sp. TaxID=1748965 RepID=A0A653A8G1_UNCDX